MQQIGIAREIYEAPVNRFVADFIGETNILAVTVDRVLDGTAQVSLPGGHRVICASAGITPGPHSLSIRPERVSLVPTGGDLTAVVTRVVYLGTDLQVITQLDGGGEVHLRMQNAARIAVPQPGTRVGLQLEEGAARLLAD